ncbi:hypothetical protein PINS_up006962 [Pythium insidiosum]|nr:hypothetical protein PINS_up006962 [Pythium insidiosum]
MTDSADMWHGLDESDANSGEFIALRKGANRGDRLSRFAHHHKTFVTERDIADIAKAGLNTVRVPVGYWIMGNDLHDPSGKEEWKTFPNDTLQYVDMLIKEWAVKHNIAVLVSIHGAKGSQNGADHSAPTDKEKTYWSDFPENVQNTVHLAKFIGDRYKNEPAFLGIGLLNEPNGKTDEKILNQYYLDAYKAVRESGNDCILSIMPLLYKQDADNLVGFMEAPAYKNVWVEWHPYFIWGFDKESPEDLVNKCIATTFQNKVNTWNSRPNSNKLFFGEWSLANTGQFKNPDSPEFQKWAEAQIKVMNQAKGGWSYWSWRLYGDDKGDFNAWSMRNVLSKQPLRNILLTVSKK